MLNKILTSATECIFLIMNFDQTYSDLRTIHILLVGVEMLPKASLDYYKDLFIANSSVNLLSINLSREASDSLLTVLPPNPSNEMVFTFHTSNLGLSYFPLHLHKTFIAIYGIGENVEDILASYKYIAELSSHYPDLLLWRLFCFEPRLEDNIYEKQAPNLILFHPNLGIEKLEMNIKIVLQDLSMMILTGILGLFQEMRARESISLPGEGDLAKVKKRKQGRLLKLQGDICFLLGAVEEAQRRYEESIEKHKSQYDWIWMAGTLESLACISCLKGEYDLASTRFIEAENNYYKVKHGRLNIECQFRFARYMAECGKKTKAVKKLTRLLDSNPEGTDQTDRMMVAKSLGLFCKKVGFERKAGFFMRLAASGCVDIMNFLEAHELLKQAAHSYQITDEKIAVNQKSREFDWGVYTLRENLKPWMRGDYSGWKNLQKITLEHLKAIAKKIGDIDSSVKYTWNLLLHSITDADFQDQLRIEIEQDAIHIQPGIEFRPPVNLISLVPVENKFGVNIPDGVFLYKPWAGQKINWIKGSLHTVKAVMQHKLSFDLHIEQTHLIIEGDAECVPSNE